MRYRALSPSGDYQYGRSGLFLTDTPAAVAQSVRTRLLLESGEWFLDADEGTPYSTQILGYGTKDTRDLAIKTRILDTPGVTELTNYFSTVTPDRLFIVNATINTKYGPASVTVSG